VREDNHGASALKRRRRRHPALLRTRGGVEKIVPGLSTWTAEDLLEAGAWDEELAQLADLDTGEENGCTEADLEP